MAAFWIRSGILQQFARGNCAGKSPEKSDHHISTDEETQQSWRP
jgi:hypothetical protein